MVGDVTVVGERSESSRYAQRFPAFSVWVEEAEEDEEEEEEAR